MEGAPKQESIESNERTVLKERIIVMLKERGAEDPETKALMGRWRDLLHAEDKSGTHRERKLGIEADIDTADFYVAAGDPIEALTTLFWANHRLAQDADSEYQLSDEGMNDDLIALVDEKIVQITSDHDPEIYDEALGRVEGEIRRRPSKK